VACSVGALLLIGLLGCASTVVAAGSAADVPPSPSANILSENAVITIAKSDYGAPDDAPASAKLIAYADWVSDIGGSDIVAIARDHPEWIVTVHSTVELPMPGPDGHPSPPPTSGYTLLMDGYSGEVIELISGTTLEAQ
jgi:hypothetical protein